MALELNGTTGVSLVQDGVITDANLPAGSVLQVVSAKYSTMVSTTSTSFVDTSLSATITPSSTSSKILVILNQTITPATSASNTFGRVRLLRGSTEIWGDDRVGGVDQYDHSTPSCTVLDSPSSTSALTYKTQFASGSGSYAFEAQHNNSREATITLMEIAG